METFRQGNIGFEAWVQTYNLDNQNPEDKERFLSNLAALQRNSALTFLLNRLEATALLRMEMAASDDMVLEEHRTLRAIKSLRQSILAFTDDRKVTEMKNATKAAK